MQARHYSQVYRRLRDLDPADYQRIIRLYEEQEDEIGRLDVLEHFELTVYYVNALFHTGAYRQHLLMVDLVIEKSICHNIHEVEGIGGDIFHQLLFHKAISAYRLQNFDLASHITRELIRMDRTNDYYTRFLRINLFKSKPQVLQAGRAFFISCILASALLITANLLFIMSFYPDFVPRMQTSILLIFGLGLLALIGTYGFAFWRAHYKAYAFQRAQANK